jgi:glycosyltransferase involved in cell wall biosynthesis
MVDIVSIVGDRAGEGCGIGDFVALINEEFERRGLTTGVVYTPALGFRDFPRIRRELALLAPRIVHFQFPSNSLGKSPSVSFLPLVHRRVPWVATICEFSVFHPMRRASLLPMPFAFDGYVVTTTDERDHLSRFNPRLPRRTGIIPAISNIRRAPVAPTRPEKRLNRVVFFGQIVPQRGLETFLDFARLAHRSGDKLQCVVVGATPAWAAGYQQSIIPELRHAGCEVHLDLPEAGVSAILQSAAFGYFPYPDGACLKRGTLPAALGHDVILLAPWGPKTEPDVKAATVAANTPAEALWILRRLRDDAGERAAREAAVTVFEERYSVRATADLYLDFYRRFSSRDEAFPAGLEPKPSALP